MSHHRVGTSQPTVVTGLGAWYDHNHAPAVGFREVESCYPRVLDKSRYAMKSYTVVIERCPETGLYVGSVPGFPGAHSQGESLDELRENMHEVIAMLLEDGEPAHESAFVGRATLEVS